MVPPDHNSPPTSGPGSRGNPLKKGKNVLKVATMKKDAYYASPINPHNPVLVWTDGTNLFFGPSQEQITAGRTSATPEPAFVPMPGFKAEEIRWDRGTASAGSGSMVIVTRKTGAKDIEVTILNTLEQISDFKGGGLTSFGKSHIARAGGQFFAADDNSVPPEISGGTAGEINGVTFSDGFFRYRATTGDHDLYIAQGTDPFAHVVERSSGKITQTFEAGTIAAVVPEESGVIHIETTTTGKKGNKTTSVDLRTSSPKISNTSGHASSETGHADAKKRLAALNITVEETGIRFRVAELKGIEEALNLGGGRGLTALKDFAVLEGTAPTILDITKSIGSDGAGGLASAGSGTPLLFVREAFAAPDATRLTTIRHEMTHVVMDSILAVQDSKLTKLERANLAASLGFEARDGLKKAKAGLLRIGEHGLGAPKRGPGTLAEWRTVVGGDPEIANIWIELLRHYSFISDPEGTGETRGVSLADESRYSKDNDKVGHPADSADEFIASFVVSATIFHDAFVDTVVKAETAGNARGGKGGTYVRRLYSKAWDLISTRYIPLGSNPF